MNGTDSAETAQNETAIEDSGANGSALSDTDRAASRRNLKRKRQRQNQRLRARAAADGMVSDSADDTSKRLNTDGTEQSSNERGIVCRICDMGSKGIFPKRRPILRSAIVCAIDNAIKWRNFVPKFLDTQFDRGNLNVRCADLASLNWLRKVITDMPPLWPQCRLDVLVQPHVLRKTKFTGFFQGPPDPINLLMPRILAQNDNLNVERWDIFDRKLEGSNGQTIVFGTDNETIELLKKVDFKIYSGLNQIQLNLTPVDESKIENTNNQLNNNLVSGFRSIGFTNGGNTRRRYRPYRRYDRPQKDNGNTNGGEATEIKLENESTINDSVQNDTTADNNSVAENVSTVIPSSTE